MSYSASPVQPIFKRNYFASLLSCMFILGFVFGAFVASNNTAHYVQLVRKAATTPVSAVWLILHITLLFSLTALICRSKRLELLHGICFLKAFIFGIVKTSVFFSYGSAQWLVSSGMLFSKTIVMISWLCFCFRNISTQSQAAQRDLVFALFVSVLGAVLDICFVSPYSSMIFV